MGESALYDKWMDGSLTREDIQAEVIRLAENVQIGLPHEYKKLNTMLTEADMNHIAYCLSKIYDWWRHDESTGSFLGSFIKNNLTRTFQMADSVNWLGIGIYVEYLHWHAPASWRTTRWKDHERRPE